MINIGSEVIVIKPSEIAGQKAIVVEINTGNDDTPYGDGGYERCKISINGEIYPQYIPTLWVDEVKED